MLIEQELVTYLKAYAGLSALISTRVYINQLPQEPTLPALVYQSITTVPYMTVSAKGVMDKVRFQFDCWGNSPLEAKQVSAQLRAALEGFIGTMGSISVRSVIPIEINSDDFDTVTSNSFRSISEYYITHIV